MTYLKPLPCPFCGSEPVIRLDDYINGKIIVDPMYYIACESSDCGVWPEAEGKYNTDWATVNNVWNRRIYVKAVTK